MSVLWCIGTLQSQQRVMLYRHVAISAHCDILACRDMGTLCYMGMLSYNGMSRYRHVTILACRDISARPEISACCYSDMSRHISMSGYVGLSRLQHIMALAHGNGSVAITRRVATLVSRYLSRDVPVTMSVSGYRRVMTFMFNTQVTVGHVVTAMSRYPHHNINVMIVML